MPGQIFDVFVLRINDLRQLLPVDQLLVNPHVDVRVKPVGRFDIVADYFGNGRSPGGRREDASRTSVCQSIIRPLQKKKTCISPF